MPIHMANHHIIINYSLHLLVKWNVVRPPPPPLGGLYLYMLAYNYPMLYRSDDKKTEFN